MFLHTFITQKTHFFIKKPHFVEKKIKFPLQVVFHYAIINIYSNDFNNKGDYGMRIRKQPIGTKNICGTNVEERRKAIGMKQKDLLTQLQIRGADLNASGLSKLEGQIRSVCDTELIALSEVLGVSVNWLLGLEDN